MSLLLAAIACVAAPSASPDAPPANASATTHGPHGGELQADGDLRAELRALPEGLLVWVHEEGRATGIEAWRAHARVRADDATRELDLHAAGDHLHAAVPLPHGQPAHVRLALTREDTTHAFDYRITAVGLSGHDHTALHGGFVAMWRDTHVEWAPRARAQRFFVTDARRAVVTQEVSGVVEDDGRTLPLTFDPVSGVLEAPTAEAGTRPVTLRAQVGDESFELRFTPAMLATAP